MRDFREPGVVGRVLLRESSKGQLLCQCYHFPSPVADSAPGKQMIPRPKKRWPSWRIGAAMTRDGCSESESPEHRMSEFLEVLPPVHVKSSNQTLYGCPSMNAADA